jgi:hypothetical protein
MNENRPAYLDFELRIDDLGGGRYRATVTEMPLGEGEAEVSNEFTLPFADDELRRTLAILSGTANATDAQRDATARSFGEALFGAVFAGQVYTVYFSSRNRANDAAGLRIKLALDNAGALMTLPWEFLRDPAVDYLALSRSTPLVRYPRRLTNRPRPSFALPLRVLVMISSPRDMPPIDEQAEWNALQAATESLRKRGLIELVLLEDASLRTLQRVLRSGEFHVFHYIGHSMYDPGTRQGMIALEDPYGEGSSFPVRGEDLARELSEENAIRLAVLNSCQSATEPGNDPFAGIASSLVQRGIPAVIAMQTVIGEEAARAFSEELYRAVAEGLPVDAAMAEARRAIDHAVGGIEWATPVLYMRAPDGVLFEITATHAAHRPAWQQSGVIVPVAAVLVMMGIVAGLLLLFRPGGGGDGPPPAALDLVIDSVEVFPPHPTPGEKAAIIVHVRNAGAGPVGPFSYDFSQDVLDETPGFTGESAGLAQGDSAALFIPHVFNWWGAFVSEVRIDVDSAVPETDEFNNTARYPVVTGDGNFAVAFDSLPDGTLIDASMAVPPDAFSGWGFRLEVVPDGDDAECAGSVPWVIVSGSSRYLGTGLPDAPDACTGGALAIVIERSPVSGVIASLSASRAADFRMTAFNSAGSEIDIVADEIGPGQDELEISGGFPTRLEVARAIVMPVEDDPLRITQIELLKPARLSIR